jgi:hypothetical protein
MKSTSTSVVVLTLVITRGAFASDLAALIPVYKPVDIVMLLNDQKVKTELKITRDQDRAVKACLAKCGEKQSRDPDTIYKMTGPNKEAKVRALTKQRAEEMFQSLGRVLSPGQVKRLKQIMVQQWGIVVFDHPGILEALKLNDGQAVRLKSIHEQMQREIIKNASDGRISRQDAQKQYNALSRGVPDRVRAALTEDQRTALNDLLGQPYSFQ